THRRGQGSRPQPGAGRTRPQERGDPDRDHCRCGDRVAHQRCDRDRDGVRAAGHRTAHGRCHPAPRLSRHPGCDPDLLRGVCAGEPRCRSFVRSVRSTGALLMSATTVPIAVPVAKSVSPTWKRFRDAFRRHPTAIVGAVILLLMLAAALLAPWLGTVDPQAVSPVKRLRPPSELYWFGTDMLGRDVYSRVVYGARVSLLVGLSVALLSTLVGLAIGLVTGYVRALDAVVMRIMDGLMSIPSVLLAIALMA